MTDPRAAAIDLARAMAGDPAFRQALADLVAFPTDASQDDAPLDGFLDHLAAGYEAMGFVTGRLRESGRPFLLASRVDHPGQPTVLSYAHGDTVPGMAGRWRDGRDPWTLDVGADGNWYGRGIADNKGQLLVNMTALQAVMAARDGTLGFNIHVLVEMGEEIGSPGLNEVAARLKDQLAADALVASDGPRVAADRPTLFLGARGAVTLRLDLKRREGGRHSGNFGGLLRNPALELAHALATISDRHGAVRVPGWTPRGVPQPVRASLADLTPAAGEIDAGWGAPGLTPAERVHAWSSAEVLAMTAGDPPDPVNAIPPSASAWVQLRYVVGVEADQIADNLRRHLDEHGFDDVEITPVGPAFAASATSPDHPAARFAVASLTRTCGAPPAVLPSLGGSLPNDVFTDTLGLPTIWVPHSYPGCSQHAPNEHLPATLFPDAAGVMAGLFWDLGTATRADLGAE